MRQESLFCFFFWKELKFFQAFALKMVIFPCSLLSHCSVWQSNPRAGITQYSPQCPCRPSWKRTLCHALYQAAAVNFTPCLVLKIRNCEVSPFSQHTWQFSYCFGHQGAGLWAGTTLVFDGGHLLFSIQLFISHFAAPHCLSFPWLPLGAAMWDGVWVP